jgi:outer membrane murein-binding lipoprotein Lpp
VSESGLPVLFLGVIAVSVLAMAAGQVAAFVLAARAVRRMGETVDRLERDVRPIVANVQAVSADAARVSAQAVVQAERAERLLDDAGRRVDETLDTVQRTILAPVRDGVALFQGLKAALGVLLKN